MSQSGVSDLKKTKVASHNLNELAKYIVEEISFENPERKKKEKETEKAMLEW